MKLKKTQLKSLTQQQSALVKGACNASTGQVVPPPYAQNIITEPPHQSR
ncbi:hypothetical protein [Pseudoalteromonas sp. S16_S37]|nr:hypothetical protein [Pseudoalteromonas sp. S16_S37]MBD1582391.1 hypothetical protein [Pseudoalteromonas sp. S16_S37]